MKRAFTFLIVVGLLGPPLSGCPNPETGKIDPYLTAKTIINQAQTALSLADGIFNQWLISTKKEDAVLAIIVSLAGIAVAAIGLLGVAAPGPLQGEL